jgi:hypothetical protein
MVYKKLVAWNDLNIDEQIERWQNVRRVLKKLTPHQKKKHFNMAHWGVKTDCGTIACAAGFCGLDPWFIKQGLKLVPKVLTKKSFKDSKYYEKDWKYYESVADILEDNKGMGNFDNGVSIEDFFGVGGTKRIFLDITHRSVSRVLGEIEEYIKYLEAEKVIKEKKYKYIYE